MLRKARGHSPGRRPRAEAAKAAAGRPKGPWQCALQGFTVSAPGNDGDLKDRPFRRNSDEKTGQSRAAADGAVAATPAGAQINAGEQKPEASLPFTMTQVATFNLPWRMAFLPDGRMLITEKVGPVWLVTPAGREDAGRQLSRRCSMAGQGGMLGVYRLAALRHRPHRLSHLYRARTADRRLQPGAGQGQAGARRPAATASLEDLKVIWRDGARGKGGQFGAAVAFAPDGKSLFLTVGRPPALDAGPGSQPAAGQDPAPDPGRQARAGQSRWPARPARASVPHHRSARATPKPPRPRRWSAPTPSPART